MDEQLLQLLKPDAVLFVGDLADGDLRLTRRITRLPFPVAVILGTTTVGVIAVAASSSNNALCSAISIALGAQFNGRSSR